MVQLWDYSRVVADRFIMLVLERAQGSLKDRLSDGALPAALVRSFAWQLSSGLR